MGSVEQAGQGYHEQSGLQRLTQTQQVGGLRGVDGCGGLTEGPLSIQLQQLVGQVGPALWLSRL